MQAKQIMNKQQNTFKFFLHADLDLRPNLPPPHPTRPDKISESASLSSTLWPLGHSWITPPWLETATPAWFPVWVMGSNQGHESRRGLCWTTSPSKPSPWAVCQTLGARKHRGMQVPKRHFRKFCQNFNGLMLSLLLFCLRTRDLPSSGLSSLTAFSFFLAWMQIWLSLHGKCCVCASRWQLDVGVVGGGGGGGEGNTAPGAIRSVEDMIITPLESWNLRESWACGFYTSIILIINIIILILLLKSFTHKSGRKLADVKVSRGQWWEQQCGFEENPSEEKWPSSNY